MARLQAGLRGKQLPVGLRLPIYCLNALVVLILLLAAANNPDMDAYQRWYGSLIAEGVTQAAREGDAQAGGNALGALVMTATLRNVSRRDNYLLLSVFTTEWPGGGGAVRAVGCFGTIIPLRKG